MNDRTAVICSLVLACGVSAHADPAKPAMGTVQPPASRERSGNTLDRGTIQEAESELTVIGLEVEPDPRAAAGEQTNRLNEYFFVLSAYIDLKKLTIRGSPFLLSGALVASDAPDTMWAVAELIASKTSAALKVIPPFVVKALPRYRTFSAVCKGPVDELDACIVSAVAEIRARGEDTLSSARVEIVSEGDTPEHAETRITFPVRSKPTRSSAAPITPAQSPPEAAASGGAPKPGTETPSPAARTETTK